MPDRFAEAGDPHAGIDDRADSLERAAGAIGTSMKSEGQGDAPWPPQYKKQEASRPAVQPSRAAQAEARLQEPADPDEKTRDSS